MCISYVTAHVKVYKTIQIIYALHNMCVDINIIYVEHCVAVSMSHHVSMLIF